MTGPPLTPDKRYIVVKGRLWRAANPDLPDERREQLVRALMDGRRAVRAALAADNPSGLTAARASVDAAKRALGERGPPWWNDGSPDFNRKQVENTPYAEWWSGLLPSKKSL